MGLIINIDCNMAKKRNINGPWLYDMRRHALFHVCTFFLFHEIYLCWFKKMVSNLTAKNHTPLPHNNASFYKCCFGMNYYTCVQGERLLGFSESWFFYQEFQKFNSSGSQLEFTLCSIENKLGNIFFLHFYHISKYFLFMQK